MSNSETIAAGSSKTFEDSPEGSNLAEVATQLKRELDAQSEGTYSVSQMVGPNILRTIDLTICASHSPEQPGLEIITVTDQTTDEWGAEHRRTICAELYPDFEFSDSKCEARVNSDDIESKESPEQMLIDAIDEFDFSAAQQETELREDLSIYARWIERFGKKHDKNDLQSSRRVRQRVRTGRRMWHAIKTETSDDPNSLGVQSVSVSKRRLTGRHPLKGVADGSAEIHFTKRAILSAEGSESTVQGGRISHAFALGHNAAMCLIELENVIGTTTEARQMLADDDRRQLELYQRRENRSEVAKALENPANNISGVYLAAVILHWLRGGFRENANS